MSQFITVTTQSEGEDVLHLRSLWRDARKYQKLNFSLTALVQAEEISYHLSPLRATNWSAHHGIKTCRIWQLFMAARSSPTTFCPDHKKDCSKIQ